MQTIKTVIFLKIFLRPNDIKKNKNVINDILIKLDLSPIKKEVIKKNIIKK
jgi:hypothetical protein